MEKPVLVGIIHARANLRLALAQLQGSRCILDVVVSKVARLMITVRLPCFMSKHRTSGVGMNAESTWKSVGDTGLGWLASLAARSNCQARRILRRNSTRHGEYGLPVDGQPI